MSIFTPLFAIILFSMQKGSIAARLTNLAAGRDRVEHSHNVIRIQKPHPAHYEWPCANNG
jgi:hypothetical protein